MIGAYGVRIVPSGKWRLINPSRAHYCHWLLSKYGSRLAYGIGIGVNSTGFLSGKFLCGLVFVLGLGVAFGLGCIGNGFCG